MKGLTMDLQSRFTELLDFNTENDFSVFVIYLKFLEFFKYLNMKSSQFFSLSRVEVET